MKTSFNCRCGWSIEMGKDSNPWGDVDKQVREHLKSKLHWLIVGMVK